MKLKILLFKQKKATKNKFVVMVIKSCHSEKERKKRYIFILLLWIIDSFTVVIVVMFVFEKIFLLCFVSPCYEYKRNLSYILSLFNFSSSFFSFFRLRDMNGNLETFVFKSH